MTPEEIITAPFTLWLAPVGTAFPAPDAAPAAPWVVLGKNGSRSYESGGIRVQHQRQIEQSRPAASSVATFAWGAGESLTIALSLIDLTLEVYAKALGGATIGTVPALPDTIGTRSMGLTLGRAPLAEFALLARGPSPYVEGENAQFQIARCVQAGSPQPTFSKAGSALDLTFTALEDPSATSEADLFGRLVATHEPGIAALLADDGLPLVTADGFYLEI